MRRKLGLSIAVGGLLYFLGLGTTGAMAQVFTRESTMVPRSDGGTFSQGELRRSGWFGGASFGRGSIEVSCARCGRGVAKLSEALSVEGHLGYMLSSRLGVVAEHWTVRYNARGGSLFDDSVPHLVAQRITSVAAQVFLTRSIWLRTGVGLGWHTTDGDYARRRQPSAKTQALAGRGGVGMDAAGEPRALPGPGGAYFAALGWEIAHDDSIAIEIQLRVASTRRPEDEYQVRNVGLNVGASWY